MFARRSVLLGLVCAAGVTIASAPAEASVNPTVRVGPWLLTTTSTVWSGTASQGLTYLAKPAAATAAVTRGWASVPLDLARSGWTHVGSPGSWSGTVIDAYEMRQGTSKLFVTTSDGRRSKYVHNLAPGESWHNSFAAVAPGGRWFVAGEWGTMRRLLVFAMPRSGVRSIALAATITLSRPVRDVQGCSFTSPTQLLCSTNDPNADLFAQPRQLVSIALDEALDGGTVTGNPRYVGPVPASTLCRSSTTMPGEVEGLATAGDVMTVAVNSPCSAQTELFSFTDKRSVVLDPDLPARWAVATAQYPARREA